MGADTFTGGTPDVSQLERYVAAVFQPDDDIELRALYKTKGGRRSAVERCKARDLADRPSVHEWINRHNRSGYGIYAVPGAMAASRGAVRFGKDCDWRGSRVLFVDWDDLICGDAGTRIESAGIPPASLVVRSGRDTGTHAYWCFDEPITSAEEFRGLQRRLIELLGSDPSVHNPARVMRLPGTRNTRYDGEPFCEIILDGPQYAAWHTLGISPKPSEEIDPIADDQMIDTERLGWGNLHTETRAFLDSGAPEGSRATSLFNAACDMSGNRIPFDDAHRALYPPADSSGLDSGEILNNIRGAYREPRNPRQYPVVGIDFDLDPYGVSKARTLIPPPTLAVLYGHAVAKREKQRRKVPVLTNVEVDVSVDPMTGKADTRFFYRSPDEITESLLDTFGNWPRQAGGQLFYDNGGACMFLPNVHALNVFLGNEGQGGWFVDKNQIVMNREMSQPVSPVSDRDFYEHLKTDSVRVTQYLQISELPQVPEVPDTYYRDCDLPPPTGEAIRELIGRLNPETELDRRLMLAALLTPGWGGPPGTRPVFLFSADQTGAGKTETAKAFGEVWGGAAALDYTSTWESVMKSLFSSSDWNSRIILFDNVKGRFGGAALEAAVTSKKLSGWKTYVGQMSRLNTATIYCTFNMPEMTHDLAERSVTIRMGKPDYGFDFVSWAYGFVRENQLQLVSDLLDILRGPDRCDVSLGVSDRWSAWQRGVLAKVPDGVSAISLSHERRQESDNDRQVGIEYLFAFGSHLAGTERGPSGDDELNDVQFSAEELQVVLERANLVTIPEDAAPHKVRSIRKSIIRAFKATEPGIVSVVRSEAGRPVLRRTGSNGEFTPDRSGKRSAVYSWSWASANSAALDASEFDGSQAPPSFLFSSEPDQGDPPI